MKTERTTLLAALDVVKPAIATKALLEELTHVWFAKDQLLAYDDVLGIRAPFQSDGLVGGIRGALLLGLLTNSMAKFVEITTEESGTEALLKASRAKLKLALLDADKAVWEYPSVKKDKFFSLTPEFMEALGDVLIAAGQDTSIPDQLGVTLSLDEDGLTLYATDANSIASASIEIPKGYDEEYLVIPTPFCEQLIRLCTEEPRMAIVKEGVVAECKPGIGVYSRLVDVPEPADFAGQLSRALPKGFIKKAVPIPPVLRLAVERALVVLDGKIAEPIKFFVKDGVLNLEADSPLGELRDSIQLEKEHEDVSIRVDPALIKRGLEKCDEMFVADSCLAMLGRKGNFVYAVSTKD